jgi:hemolysin activation/secretion protein
MSWLTIARWWSLAGVLALLLSHFWLPCVHGQVLTPSIDPTLRSGEQPQIQREQPRPAVPAVPVLPPITPAAPQDFGLVPSLSVFVREIRVVGNTVLTEEDIAAATRPYLQRTLTHEDLEALRVALTTLYVNKGYVNSGAILPDQTVANGTVTYRIIEGRVTDIEVFGNKWFRSEYLQRRLALGIGPPLNVNELQDRFQLLLEDQRIQRLGAELKPGVRPGEATLSVQVEEHTPYRFWLDLDNYQTPSVGAERGILGFEHNNVTGNGDVLRLRYGRSSGLDPLVDLRYAVPVNARDTTLFAQYRKDRFSVVETPFDRLDIGSRSEIYTLGVRHPVIRTRSNEIALEASGERSSNRTTLLGSPFSFSPGARQGESVSTALRFVQELVSRSADQVLALRSRFSFGVDALGATINDDSRLPSGKFFAWLGQFQWVRRLQPNDTQIVVRADMQRSRDPLLALEQFAVGGRYSVRGYRENTFVRDNAVVASAELRVPLVRNVSWADSLELAPFVDFGKAWNAKPLSAEYAPHIWSAGLGLRWNARIDSANGLRPQFEIYWGRAMRNVPSPGGDLQDRGIHFQLLLATP